MAMRGNRELLQIIINEKNLNLNVQDLPVRLFMVNSVDVTFLNRGALPCTSLLPMVTERCSKP